MFNEAGFESIKEEIGLAKELHKTLPATLESGEDAFDPWRKPTGEDSESSEELRRQLAEFSLAMQELDPASAEALSWGDLRRIHMPDNKFRWLCAEHRPD